MAQIFDIQLTQGNSEGTYSVYYNQVDNSFFATAVTTNQLATNLSLSTMLTGLQVAIPDSATKIIIFGSVCKNVLEFNVKPIEEPPPIYNTPALCMTYFFDEKMSYQLTFLPDSVLVNGKPRWTSGSYYITWNPNYNNGVGRWEMILSNSEFFWSNYSNIDGIPDGTWYSTNQNVKVTVQVGICPKTENILNVNLSSTPNSCFKSTNNPKDLSSCDGTITAVATGGNPPYYYSLDGGTPQLFNTFNSVCPGNHVVITRDSNGLISNDNIEVGAGEQTVSGPIQFTTTETLTTVRENYASYSQETILDVPAVERGTIFTVQLIFNGTETTGQPGLGQIQNSIRVYKDTTEITDRVRRIMILNSIIPDCTPLQQTQSFITYLYEFNFTYPEQIKIITDSILNITTPQVINNCATYLTDELSLKINLTNITCNCCSITGGYSNVIYSNTLNATNIPPSFNIFCLNYGISCSEAINTQILQNKSVLPSCQYQTYYSQDTTIQINTILYQNNTQPLETVIPGYYADLTTGSDNIYVVNSGGIVSEIIDQTNTDCQNLPPSTSYKYYEARKYFCGSCGDEQYITYVAANSRVSLTINHYYTTEPNSDDNSVVYKIKDGPFDSITQPYENIIDSRTGASVCERSCYGNIIPE